MENPIGLLSAINHARPCLLINLVDCDALVRPLRRSEENNIMFLLPPLFLPFAFLIEGMLHSGLRSMPMEIKRNKTRLLIG